MGLMFQESDSSVSCSAYGYKQIFEEGDPIYRVGPTIRHFPPNHDDPMAKLDHKVPLHFAQVSDLFGNASRIRVHAKKALAIVNASQMRPGISMPFCDINASTALHSNVDATRSKKVCCGAARTKAAAAVTRTINIMGSGAANVAKVLFHLKSNSIGGKQSLYAQIDVTAGKATFTAKWEDHFQNDDGTLGAWACFQTLSTFEPVRFHIQSSSIDLERLVHVEIPKTTKISAFCGGSPDPRRPDWWLEHFNHASACFQDLHSEKLIDNYVESSISVKIVEIN